VFVQRVTPRDGTVILARRESEAQGILAFRDPEGELLPVVIGMIIPETYLMELGDRRRISSHNSEVVGLQSITHFFLLGIKDFRGSYARDCT